MSEKISSQPIDDIVKVGKSGETFHRPDGKFLSAHEKELIEANADFIRDSLPDSKDTSDTEASPRLKLSLEEAQRFHDMDDLFTDLAHSASESNKAGNYSEAVASMFQLESELPQVAAEFGMTDDQVQNALEKYRAIADLDIPEPEQTEASDGLAVGSVVAYEGKDWAVAATKRNKRTGEMEYLISDATTKNEGLSEQRLVRASQLGANEEIGVGETPEDSSEAGPEFAVGDTVTVIRTSGDVEDDWTVAEVTDDFVDVTKDNGNGETLHRTYTHEELRNLNSSATSGSEQSSGTVDGEHASAAGLQEQELPTNELDEIANGGAEDDAEQSSDSSEPDDTGDSLSIPQSTIDELDAIARGESGIDQGEDAENTTLDTAEGALHTSPRSIREKAKRLAHNIVGGAIQAKKKAIETIRRHPKAAVGIGVVAAAGVFFLAKEIVDHTATVASTGGGTGINSVPSTPDNGILSIGPSRLPNVQEAPDISAVVNTGGDSLSTTQEVLNGFSENVVNVHAGEGGWETLHEAGVPKGQWNATWEQIGQKLEATGQGDLVFRMPDGNWGWNKSGHLSSKALETMAEVIAKSR